MSRARSLTIWAALLCAIAIPVGMAATSPLLAWREWVYIAAGFAGILALALLLVQPLLIGGYLPGLSRLKERQVHRATGAMLVFLVVVHVAGLFATSPPDVVDALLFVSPTPFSHWGVIAMWALFGSALLVFLRKRARVGSRRFRVVHTALAAIIVPGSVAHAMLIEGTMEVISKALLCILVIAATGKVFYDLKVWRRR